MTVLDTLRQSRLLAIVRNHDAGRATRIVGALIDSGIDMIEISLTTPDAIEIIRSFADSSSGALVGAGTVLTAAQASAAVDAGARFIVTPVVSQSLDEAARLAIPSFVGAMTPTEAFEAIERGASAVKLFPAEIGGPRFLRAIRAPFPDYEFVPVGGVTLDLVSEYLDAGALGLGVGSPLTGNANAGADLGPIRERANAYREGVARWRAGHANAE